MLRHYPIVRKLCKYENNKILFKIIFKGFEYPRSHAPSNFVLKLKKKAQRLVLQEIITNKKMAKKRNESSLRTNVNRSCNLMF
jgi:hypothetical protein